MACCKGSWTVHYFPGRGRAEQLRLALAESGAEWKNNNFTDLMKARETLNLAWGSLPCLEDPQGHHMVQSGASLRLLGKLFNMYPSNPCDQYKVDSLIDACEDARIASYRGNPNFGATDADLKAFLEIGVPRWLGNFEKFLSSNNDGQGFFVTENITVADIAVFALLDSCKSLVPGSVDKYPKLSAFFNRIASRPRIAAYLSSDKLLAAPSPLPAPK
eukprot:TRINITY_DN12775_c0_g1::TRINITY_DN12775_c0_g1_i1::g.28637::m.28637 TRINITY_DN12775_c0_g1::TRINITY_DN12775_c0_g1_i1::g.28637  ORF type:complete len:234 (+),score=55.94,sp/P81942/GSTP1_BUFBU/36.45/2e-30,GST_C/PF00043.20/2e-12,GST_N/PF02798.15/2.7e-10,GST_C_3/PF14497.1/2.3e-07,GST_C_2/PF13410.1/0.0038 TRINITY_DN12775_c0_g1_i1:54-704(+)